MMEWILSASLLILVVLALRAVLGRRIGAGLRYGLWVVVLVRLLVPVSFLTLALPVPRVPAWTLPEVMKEESIYVLPVDSAPLENSGVRVTEDGALMDTGSYGYPHLTDDGERVVRYADRISPLELLGWVWLGGAAVMGAALIAANLRFAIRLRRVRKPLTGTSAPVPVYQAPGLPSPCLMGLLRPAVYVTEEAAADPVMLRHVLAHELTHYCHLDHLWSVLRGAALAVHWWNPLVWLAVVCSRRDGELACDEGALKRLGDGERAAYGETLLALVTSKRKPGDLLSFATTMSGGKRSLRERIRFIARRPKRLVSAMAVAVAVVALSSVVAFGQAEKDASTGTPVDPAEDWQEDIIQPARQETADDGDSLAADSGQWQTDLDHDGKPDELILQSEPDPSGWSYDGTVWTLQCSLSSGGTWEIEGKPSLPGENAVFLYQMDGEDYLLVYTPNFWHGQGYYEYRLIYLNGGREVVVQENSLDFSVKFFDDSFDPNKIAAFMDEVNALLTDSTELVNTNIYLQEVFADEGRLYDRLYWLDNVREDNLSLLENLQNYADYGRDHPDDTRSPLADLLQDLTEENIPTFEGDTSELVRMLQAGERGSRFYTWATKEDAYLGHAGDEVDYNIWDIPLADGNTLWLMACEERASVLVMLETPGETYSAFYDAPELKDMICRESSPSMADVMANISEDNIYGIADGKHTTDVLDGLHRIADKLSREGDNTEKIVGFIPVGYKLSADERYMNHIFLKATETEDHLRIVCRGWQKVPVHSEDQEDGAAHFQWEWYKVVYHADDEELYRAICDWGIKNETVLERYQED